jgi:glycosyltransferase involved in cell wall biosynthesis
MNGRPLFWPECGTKTYLRNLIAELAADDKNELTLLVNRNDVDVGPQTTRSLVKIPPFGTSFKENIFWEFASVPIASVFMSGDVLHSPYHSTTIRTRSPSIMTIHDAIPWELPLAELGVRSPRKSVGSRIHEGLLLVASRRSDVILTVSDFSKMRLVELLNLDPDRIFVTPNAVSAAFTPGNEKLGRRPVSLGTANKPYILYAGGSLRRKGVVQLLRAYDALRADLRASHDLVVVGDFSSNSDDHGEVMKMAGQPRASGTINMVGLLSESDLVSAYREATAFVFPSFMEGFGITPLEAMSCGTPVIVSNRSSLPEVVGNAGLYFDPSDIDSIVDAITTVLESTLVQQALREKGLERARSFSWRKTANLTMNAYLQAMR